ncbi:hypothetical protein [Brevibacillus sp. SIMBA_040]
MSQSFYKSRRWKRKRATLLRRSLFILTQPFQDDGLHGINDWFRL